MAHERTEETWWRSGKIRWRMRYFLFSLLNSFSSNFLASFLSDQLHYFFLLLFKMTGVTILYFSRGPIMFGTRTSSYPWTQTRWITCWVSLTFIMRHVLKCKWGGITFCSRCMPIISIYYFASLCLSLFFRSFWTFWYELRIGEERHHWPFTDTNGGRSHQDPTEEPEWILPPRRG